MIGRSASSPDDRVHAAAEPARGHLAGRPRRAGDPGVRYEFLLSGRVSELVLSAFPELTTVVSPAGGSAMYGPVKDDAHLHGLLDRFQTLGLTVLELRQLPD